MEVASSQHRSAGSGLFTIPLLCLGIAIIACCVLIPQVESNRRMAYEKLRLSRDLAQLTQQSDVNKTFLKKLGDDPDLAQRLAQRQMKLVPEGTNILDLPGESQSAASPYQLVQVSPPAELSPYKPSGWGPASVFLQSRERLYLLGAGMLLIAGGLVLGTQ